MRGASESVRNTLEEALSAGLIARPATLFGVECPGRPRGNFQKETQLPILELSEARPSGPEVAKSSGFVHWI